MLQPASYANLQYRNRPALDLLYDRKEFDRSSNIRHLTHPNLGHALIGIGNAIQLAIEKLEH
jgi:hypothetical protein